MGSTEITKVVYVGWIVPLFSNFALVQIVFQSRYREGRYSLEGDHSNLLTRENYSVKKDANIIHIWLCV
jgi:hypothetical protein